MFDSPDIHEFSMADVVAAGDFLSERRDTMSVLWAITKGCSFRCSYCSYHNDLRSTEFSSKEQLLRAARRLLQMGRPGYQITLYGGEPTYHPHFMDLLEYLATADSNVDLRMFTNGSRSDGFFERMMDVVGVNSLRLIFSFHPEFAKFEKFKRLLVLTAGAGMAVGISFMFVPTRAEEARRQMADLLTLRQSVPFFLYLNYPYDACGKLGVGCSARDTAWVEQTRAEFDAIPAPAHLRTPFYTRIMSNVALDRGGGWEVLPARRSLQFLSAPTVPSYQGFYCCCGANVLFVEEDGTARGAVCDTSPEIGNLFRDSEIKLAQGMQIVRCCAPGCASIENTPLPKFRSRAKAEECLSAFRARAKGYVYHSEACRLALPQSANVARISVA
jgi:hypothetical protein